MSRKITLISTPFEYFKCYRSILINLQKQKNEIKINNKYYKVTVYLKFKFNWCPKFYLTTVHPHLHTNTQGSHSICWFGYSDVQISGKNTTNKTPTRQDEWWHFIVTDTKSVFRLQLLQNPQSSFGSVCHATFLPL